MSLLLAAFYNIIVIYSLQWGVFPGLQLISIIAKNVFSSNKLLMQWCTEYVRGALCIHWSHFYSAQFFFHMNYFVGEKQFSSSSLFSLQMPNNFFFILFCYSSFFWIEDFTSILKLLYIVSYVVIQWQVVNIRWCLEDRCFFFWYYLRYFSKINSRSGYMQSTSPRFGTASWKN